MVPRTEGCGEQLFIRMMVAGRANVRAMTCMHSTPERASQTRTPEAWVGGGLEEGMRER